MPQRAGGTYYSLTSDASAIPWWKKEAVTREKLYSILRADSEKAELGRAYLFLSYGLRNTDPDAAQYYADKLASLDVYDEMFAYSEVLEVLRHMEEKYVNMLPKSLITYLYNHANFENEFRLTEPLNRDTLSPKAAKILSMISSRYWTKRE